ncbi:MAG: redoxin family protein [Phycisphaerales bacterium]
MLKIGLSVGLILSLAGAASAQETPATPAPAKEPAAKQPAAKTEPSLKVGDKAPALSVEKWVKGEPITGFEKGKVYVVEFWATWCGPCIAQFPHLSELQSEYKDKGLTIIGTNIWEDAHGMPPYSDETLANVKDFVKEQGPRMEYHVAYDGGTKAMDKNWMKAAGRNGIPSAFVVDQNGVVVYADHPMFLDVVIDDVLAGKWDPKTGSEKVKKLQDDYMSLFRKSRTDAKGALADWEKFEKDYPKFAAHQSDMKLRLLMSAGEWDEAYKVMGKQVDAAIKAKDSAQLNALAWGIVDPEAKVEKRDVDLAMRAAKEAVQLTNEKDGAILDTLARCYWLKGDKAKAIETQKKAVAVATPQFKDQLEETLDEYQKDAK